MADHHKYLKTIILQYEYNNDKKERVVSFFQMIACLLKGFW